MLRYTFGTSINFGTKCFLGVKHNIILSISVSKYALFCKCFGIADIIFLFNATGVLFTY